MMKKSIFLFIMILSLVSCETHKALSDIQYVTVHDTLQTYRERVDSVYQHDSIYICQKGDTVTRDRWHTTYRYKYLTRDSIVLQHDTISVTQTKQVKYTPRLTKYLATFGAIVLIGLLAWLIIWAVQEYRARGI